METSSEYLERCKLYLKNKNVDITNMENQGIMDLSNELHFVYLLNLFRKEHPEIYHLEEFRDIDYFKTMERPPIDNEYGLHIFNEFDDTYLLSEIKDGKCWQIATLSIACISECERWCNLDTTLEEFSQRIQYLPADGNIKTSLTKL